MACRPAPDLLGAIFYALDQYAPYQLRSKMAISP
jgi:hypothetical protein